MQDFVTDRLKTEAYKEFVDEIMKATKFDNDIRADLLAF
jgi:hypothetical protein